MEIDDVELIGKEPHTCEALVKKEVVLKNHFRKKDALKKYILSMYLKPMTYSINL